MGRRIPAQLCTRCKGYKKLCGLSSCPILAKFRAQITALANIPATLNVQGSTPPSIIIGEKHYPKVPILYTVPPGVTGQEATIYDHPIKWSTDKLPLRTILELRAGTLSSTIRVRVDNPWKLYESEISLAAVSTNPVDSEAYLEKRPTPTLRFDGTLTPYGPTAPARRIKITTNPLINPKLDKLIHDDVSSQKAIIELYSTQLDIYTIIRALSLGLLGRSRSRRLVPTRWAITAVDQTIATHLLHKVRTFKPVNKIEIYYGGYLGNYFTIILLPGSYEAEMVEIWHPLTPWTQSSSEPVAYFIREYNSLRIEPLDGGYIASRLPVAEHLYTRKRQAKVLIIREITREYYAPVGNWHIRETTRKILSKQPLARVDTVEEAIEIIKNNKLPKSRTYIKTLYESSLLRKYYLQTTLDKYLSSY